MSDSSPTDPTSSELRRLLRTDELGVDPAQRERAIGAALAAADELGASPAAASTAVGSPTPPDAGPVVVPFGPRGDHRRLRVIATAAAVLLVFAGVASVIANPLSDGSGQDSSESATELSTGAADSTAGSRDGAGAAADATISTTTMPATLPAETAESATQADEGLEAFTTGLVDLGEFDDVQALIAAAPLTTDADPAGASKASAVDPSSACGLVLSSTGSVAVAVARLDGVAVIVARSRAAGGDVSVLSSPDCTLLASG